tara:strand:- start:137 stop:1264 length:1128 start_codon:yes stop_codon:yes gene_type:complete
MAIKVNGTTVINDSRALSNIASVDATTAASMTAAGVGGTPTTSAGNMLRTMVTPSGYSWNGNVSVDGNQYFFSGVAQSGDVIVLSGYSGYQGANTAGNFVSTDNGATWTRNSFTGFTGRGDIDTDGNGNWIQIFASGACKRSTDNAATWTTSGSATAGEGNTVLYIGNSTWLTVSDGGNTAKRSTDVGANWSNVSLGMGNPNLTGLAHDGAGTVIAIGFSGTSNLSRSTNYGATWSAINLSSSDPHAIGTDGNGNWIVVPEGTTYSNTYVSSDNGASWTNKGSFNHSSYNMSQPNLKGTMGYSDRSGYLTEDNDTNFWSCSPGSSILGNLYSFIKVQSNIPQRQSGRTRYTKKATDRETFWSVSTSGRLPAMVKA